MVFVTLLHVCQIAELANTKHFVVAQMLVFVMPAPRLTLDFSMMVLVVWKMHAHERLVNHVRWVFSGLAVTWPTAARVFLVPTDQGMDITTSHPADCPINVTSFHAAIVRWGFTGPIVEGPVKELVCIAPSKQIPTSSATGVSQTRALQGYVPQMRKNVRLGNTDKVAVLWIIHLALESVLSVMTTRSTTSGSAMEVSAAGVAKSPFASGVMLDM